MKLLDVMKKYDRCVMRESAKLTKIYNLLLKESAEADDIEEAEVCPDCGNDPCTCECGESEDAETDEAEEMISAEEFFGEAEKATKEGCDETEDVEENDMLRNRPHNAHIDDPAGIKESDDHEEKTDEAEEMMSAEEFFSELDDSEENTDESDDSEENTDEAEEMMSAEEFFSEGDDDKSEENNESDEKSDDKKVTESDESEEKKDEVDESECDEDDEEKEEKKLEESLKSYRRANHQLFNG